MIDKVILQKRKWPKPLFPIGEETAGSNRDKEKDVLLYDDYGKMAVAKPGYDYVQLACPEDYIQSPYVEENKVSIIQHDSAILPGSCGTVDFVHAGNGIIYGITAGECSHVFSFQPEDKVTKNCGIVGKNSKNAFLIYIKDKLFIGLDVTSGSPLYCYSPQTNNIEPVYEHLKNEGIAALVRHGNNIYGLTNQTGTFFIFDMQTGTGRLLGPIDSDNIFSSVLTAAPDGNIYGAARWGHLFHYDSKKDKIVDEEISVPYLAGREMYTSVKTMLTDSENMLIYGGTSADGILFCYDLMEKEMVSLGKLLNQPGIRCLVKGSDGCIYGIAGDKCCHLFRYNPENRDLRDLGIFKVSTPRFWHGYEFDAAINIGNKNIFFGENDRCSHVFKYQI